jgi:hypothetical protein
MKGVFKTEYLEKEILVIDYSNCKEAEMIERLTYAKALVESENKPVLVLNLLNEKTYVTPNFVRLAEKINTERPELIYRQSVVGLTKVQKMILKGFNMFTAKKELKNFDTTTEALNYLVEQS